VNRARSGAIKDRKGARNNAGQVLGAQHGLAERCHTGHQFALLMKLVQMAFLQPRLAHGISR